MRTAALMLALCLSGCLYAPPESAAPAPVPAGLEGASEQTIRVYAAGMADLCDSTAADLEAGKFKAQSQVTEAFKAKSQAIRESAFGDLGKAMDAVVPPGKDLSAKATADAYRSMAKGFRKAAGK